MGCILDGVPYRKQRPRRRSLVRAWIQRAGRRILGSRKDWPFLCRWTTHLSIVGLGLLAVVASRAAWRPPWPAGGAALSAPRPAEVLPLSRHVSARGGTGYLVRAAVPRTTVAETPPSGSAPAQVEQAAAEAAPAAEPPGIRAYVVQPGDTVIGLAERLGITPETIVSANSSLAGNPDLLLLGQELQILPVSGVLHVVSSGDTLAAIAQRYKVGIDAITGYKGNNLSEPYTLYPGQKLVVVGGEWTYTPPSPSSSAAATAAAGVKATGSFAWPTTGRITQGVWAGHVAIDLASAPGTAIYASDAGYVAESGWSNVGYGEYVLLDHGNGYRTLYAHMSSRLVEVGQIVEQGQKIGLVGSTGNSTGPHLHFEIYRNGILQNPLAYLP